MIQALSREQLAPRLLNDPRDWPLLAHLTRSSIIVVTALMVFAASTQAPFVLLVACVAHLAVYLVSLEQFVTMLHDVNHHPLFRKPLGGLNTYITWVYGPLFGSTPHRYYAHHILMHHPADNLPSDASTTMPYRRDSFADFARYYRRRFFCLAEVRDYLRANYPNEPALVRRLVVGEVSYWAVALLLAPFFPVATLIVFVVPLLITRSLLIIGNWAKHAFVDPAAPDNAYRSSTDLIGDKVNRRSFNVGYHIGHHIRPGAHFSSQPDYFTAHIRDYGENDAVVLRDLHYPDLWFLLMTKDYDRIADHFVLLPHAPKRDRDQVIALLKSRVEPIHAR